jgi:hypothetical protein
MNTKIASILLTSTFMAFVSINIAQVLNKKDKGKNTPAEEVSKVTEFKQKSRENLKPYRYDACAVTHFSFSAYEQSKEVELLLFSGTEYKLCFNTEGTPKPIGIRIYDKPSGNQTRALIYEEQNVQGRDVNIITADLEKKYKEMKKSESATLKRLYINYLIPANETKEPLKGFAIVSYGYKNV